MSRGLTAAFGRHMFVQGNCCYLQLDQGWSGLSAELCTARRGVIRGGTPQSDIRICIAVRSNRSDCHAARRQASKVR